VNAADNRIESDAGQDPAPHGRLRALRLSRIVTFSVALAGPLFTAVAYLSDQGFTALAIVMTWVPAFGLAALFQASLVCPRCGRPFFRSATRRSPAGTLDLLTRRCEHCGLGWAPGPPQP